MIARYRNTTHKTESHRKTSLLELRNDIAMYGHKHNKCDIYGSSWEEGVSIGGSNPKETEDVNLDKKQQTVYTKKLSF